MFLSGAQKPTVSRREVWGALPLETSWLSGGHVVSFCLRRGYENSMCKVSCIL